MKDRNEVSKIKVRKKKIENITICVTQKAFLISKLRLPESIDTCDSSGERYTPFRGLPLDGFLVCTRPPSPMRVHLLCWPVDDDVRIPCWSWRTDLMISAVAIVVMRTLQYDVSWFDYLTSLLKPVIVPSLQPNPMAGFLCGMLNLLHCVVFVSVVDTDQGEPLA